jgi:maltodextrin utilization protein YvdJ
MHHSNLFEGLEQGDLKRLIHPELHVDEFKSKLGDDQDVVVLSFKVDNKEPANDLTSFIEKGYDWVIDADVSAGEMDDGSYIVFVELDRTAELAENIMKLMEDLFNLTAQTEKDWRVRYYKSHKETTLSLESLNDLIPSTPEAYEKAYGHEVIDKLKTAAGVDVGTKAPKNDYTETLRNLAGIIR